MLSVNRFERKKNVGLAVKAVAALSPGLRSRVTLVLAGGYDVREDENVQVAREMEQLGEEHGVSLQLRKSISNDLKLRLLARASCLLYTPDKEHFGIVPVEAMYARCPVIAVSSGGPLESIEDGVTGFLREGQAEAFAEPLAKLLSDTALQKRVGDAGRERVLRRFTLEIFRRSLDAHLRAMFAKPEDGVASAKPKQH